MIHRLWLIFAQAVTVAMAVVLVLSTFMPDWLRPAAPVVVVQNEAPPAATGGAAADTPGSYAKSRPYCAPLRQYIFTSKEMQSQRSPFLDDPIFRHFFGDRLGPRQEQRTSGLGSGVIASAEGYILTNNHVIEAADAIEVALNDGRKFEAKLVGRDPETDLAVLRIEAGSALPAVSFAPSESLSVGDVVLAIGNPFGVGQTVTMGIVSALQRSHLGISTFENFIQTDAAINPGNSGGALVNSEGALVGINAAIYSRSGGSLGIGFAIPVTFAKDVMDQIIRTGRVTRGWIGVEIQDITPELAESFDLPDTEGALIAGVMRGGPADKGGIQPGDVLIGIGTQPIASPQRMLELVAALAPGADARFTVRRKKQVIELPVKIGRRPTIPRPQ